LSTLYESADLLMKLYELRREPTMREARAWFAADFNPATFEDVQQAIRGPKSAQFRMVTSYWDMAASFVTNGAIDETMFNDANAEQFVVFAKVEPFVAKYREMMVGAPRKDRDEDARCQRPAGRDARALPRHGRRTARRAAGGVGGEG
jgi:hypothetical protein